MTGLMCVIGVFAAVTYPIATTTPSEPASIERRIEISADKYGANSDVLRDVLTCESGLRPDAVGDHGESFGIAQIHLPDHPNITIDQALDADFSIDFIAREFSIGHAWKWSCWKILYLSPALSTYR